MVKRLALGLLVGLGLIGAALPQGLNLNNFGSQPVFQLTPPQTNGQTLCYSTAVSAWINSNCGGGGSGSVTSVSVVSANGFSGSVATATTTPAITLSTSISGPLKGSSGALAAAAAADISGLYGGASGTGTLCLTTNCAMITPNVGTPSAINLANATNLPASALPAFTGDATSSAGSSALTLATVNSNVGSFTNASITVNAKGLVTAASSGAATPTAANPTGTVGLTAVNGTATTFMRSDAAPPLSQGIVPTWTGVHTFSAAPVFNAGETLTNAANAYTQTSTGLSLTAGTTGFGRNIAGTVNDSSAVDGIIDFANITCTLCTATSYLVDWQVSSSSVFNVATSGTVTTGSGASVLAGGAVQAGAAFGIQWNGRGLMTSPGAGQIQLGSTNASSGIVSQTLSTQGALGGTASNVAGGNLTIQSGLGTGNATASTLSLKVPAATTSGTTQQTAFTEISISSGNIAFGDSTNNPTYSFPSSGLATFTGGITVNNVLTANRVVVANSTIPTNGIYLPAANTMGIAGGSTEAASFTSTVDTLLGTTVSFPNISSSSAAQTGTLCWASTGITYDPTLGCLTSLGAWKQHIENLSSSLGEIMQLHPVSYELKPEFDPTHQGRQVGFLAEQVEKIDKRLVGYGGDGQLRGVRYMQLTAVLTEGEQELYRIIERQQWEILGLAAWCTGLTLFLIIRRRT